MIDAFDLADLRTEAACRRRAARRGHACQCGDDLPGTCPGPRNCPYSDFEADDDDDPED